MGFEISGDFGDIERQLRAGVVDEMHEAIAQGVAEKAREHGLASADSMKLELSSDSDDPDLQIDTERVRRRANEILASDG